jgi:hypothetical protein
VFKKFVKYYGVSDYGSKFVTAALDGSKVTFSTPGTFDFSADYITAEDRSTAAIVGMQSMLMPMQVIGELENAIDTCSRCVSATCKSLDSLYKAVAYYTGSMDKTILFEDGSPLADIHAADGSRNSLYNYADIICMEFGTCKSSSDLHSTDDPFTGTSNVNYEIFAAFSAMRIYLINDCEEAYAQKEIIAKKIFIPLIQGMFSLSFMHQNPITKALPSGPVLPSFTLAASVLPLVHHCNSTHAKTILQNYVGQNSAFNFATIKAALEVNYNCLGITSAEVGSNNDIVLVPNTVP